MKDLATPRDTFVYRCYDRYGRLIYVGVTSSPRARRWSHNSSSPWFKYVAAVRMAGPYDRGTALQIEADMIRHERPARNIIRPLSSAETSYSTRLRARVNELAGPQVKGQDEEARVSALQAAYAVAHTELDPFTDGTCRAYQLLSGRSK